MAGAAAALTALWSAQPASAALSYVESSSTVTNSGGTGTALATCGGGSFVIGGGAFSTGGFGQVSIDRPLIDRRGNCGNISSAVGPFAVDEGLVIAHRRSLPHRRPARGDR